ncbi:MAG: peptidase prolyl oligopeptidase active site domain protein [Phenylobacterium sp.]|nr:peptidase prolyl oligopeptidase active site domain protein [Phenylobacterium sp.]
MDSPEAIKLAPRQFRGMGAVMKTTVKILAAAVLAAAAASATGAAWAQEKASATRMTTDHYFDLERISDAQISPDGSRIIYTRQQVNRLEDKWEPALWIINADGSQNRFLAKGGSARWAADGKRILYIAEADGRPQVFVRWIDVDGSPSQVTRATDKVADARWSPDGKSIAFTMFVPDKPKWAISMPAEPKGAKWTPAPRIVESLHYRQDQVGFLDDGHIHLFVVPADGGAARQLTSGAWNVGAGELRAAVPFDWMPDGKTIVLQASRDFDRDTTYQRAQLLAVDVATAAARELVAIKGEWGQPAISPDGKLVAFVGYAESKKTHTVADLYVAPTAGGEMRKLSGGYDRDPINLRWAPDGSGVYFDADDHGSRNVSFASLKGGVRPVTTGAHMLGLDSTSKTLIGAGTISDPDHPAEVVRYDLRHPNQVARLSNINAAMLSGMTLGHTQEITWTSSGNVPVQGWYITPPGFDPAKKYPLILEIHGGPYGNYNTGFSPMWQNFAANDFVVLYLNPRGSTGYGQAFIDGIDHNYPGPDYDDLMTGVDALAAKGFVDRSRMYVSGCSGGGVLSSWVIGHTDKFAAAAVRCPVIDWLSMAGDTDLPLFTYSFFDKPFWEDPSSWLAHSSLMSVGHVTTPTLLMTGVLDRRTPMPQTEEYFSALKMRGVPTKLLQFEGEFHGTGSKPSNWVRTQLYMMSWFNRYSRNPDLKVVSREAPAAAAVAAGS